MGVGEREIVMVIEEEKTIALEQSWEKEEGGTD